MELQQIASNCPVSCDLPCSTNATFLPPPPPPCDTSDDFTARAAEVTAECCDEPTESCAGGYPNTCNAGCAAVLLPVRDSCVAGYLSTGGPVAQALAQALDSGAAACPAAAGTNPCSSRPCLNGGVCNSGVGGLDGGNGHRILQAIRYTCACGAGYSGDRCDVSTQSQCCSICTRGVSFCGGNSDLGNFGPNARHGAAPGGQPWGHGGCGECSYDCNQGVCRCGSTDCYVDCDTSC
eukprot:SAG31_NODE_3046_length_4750_cov_4.985594_2_plen_236_part_00